MRKSSGASMCGFDHAKGAVALLPPPVDSDIAALIPGRATRQVTAPVTGVHDCGKLSQASLHERVCDILENKDRKQFRELMASAQAKQIQWRLHDNSQGRFSLAFWALPDPGVEV